MGYEGQADMNWLWKTTVGRRCGRKTLPQRFLAQPDGQNGLRPCAAVTAEFSSSLFALISVHSRLKISVVRLHGSLCVLRDLRVQNPNSRLSLKSLGSLVAAKSDLKSEILNFKYPV
jgi:hypothetical protein